MGDVNSRADRECRTTVMPCLCAALRQAARAVTRLYDAELRGNDLRVTQFTLLRILSWSGEVRQGELGELASIDETTLTRSLRPLEKAGWVAIRAGSDRREKRVAITNEGTKKLAEAHLAWSRAQGRMRRSISGETWNLLLKALPDVTQRASKTTSGETS